MRCPLTLGMGTFLPCGPRRVACGDIASMDSLPLEGCRMRQRIIDLAR